MLPTLSAVPPWGFLFAPAARGRCAGRRRTSPAVPPWGFLFAPAARGRCAGRRRTSSAVPPWGLPFAPAARGRCAGRRRTSPAVPPWGLPFAPAARGRCAGLLGAVPGVRVVGCPDCCALRPAHHPLRPAPSRMRGGRKVGGGTPGWARAGALLSTGQQRTTHARPHPPVFPPTHNGRGRAGGGGVQDVKRSSPAHHPRRPVTAPHKPRAAAPRRRRKQHPHGRMADHVGRDPRRQAQTV